MDYGAAERGLDGREPQDTTGATKHTLVGLSVGAQRWPYSHAHPDCWRRPWRGVVLAADDPRAWANTLRFPVPAPDRTHVAEHVARCVANGLLAGLVPVLWDFDGWQRVWWERVQSVRPYDEDLAQWELARDAARTALTSGLR